MSFEKGKKKKKEKASCQSGSFIKAPPKSSSSFEGFTLPAVTAGHERPLLTAASIMQASNVSAASDKLQPLRLRGQTHGSMKSGRTTLSDGLMSGAGALRLDVAGPRKLLKET